MSHINIEPTLSQYTPHFITGTYTPNITRLDDQQYSAALDCIVKVCNDILLFNTDNTCILLGKRTMYPQRDWWYACGGRMRCNETIAHAVQRLLRTELHIDISIDILQQRIETIGHYMYTWGKREQPPQDNGTADCSIVIKLSLEQHEIDTIQQSECSHIQWYNLYDILYSTTLHPALIRNVCDYIKLCLHQQLYSLIVHSKRINLLPDNIDINELIQSRIHYLSDCTTVDHTKTQLPTANCDPQTNGITHKIQAHNTSDSINADAIVAATRQYYAYCHWLQQYDQQQITVTET